MSMLQKFRHFSVRYGVLHAAAAGIGRKKFGVWKLAGPLVSRGYARTYCRKAGPRGLNLGSGSNLIEGMLNVDIDPRADSWCDLTRPLAFPDEAFDVISSEEVLEHVDEVQGARLLAECWRVMKPGGRIHIATPGLDYFAARVAEKDPEGEAINAIFYEHGHRFIYSQQRLEKALSSAGFAGVTFYGYKDPAALLGQHDSHADRFDHDPAISLYVEASKPGSGAQTQAFKALG